MLCKNEVLLRGWIQEPFKYRHTTESVEIYEGFIRTVRKSGTEDVIPLHITKEQLDALNKVPVVGDFMEITGGFHSRNVYDDENKRHLQLYVQVRKILYRDAEEFPSENLITLSGKIVSQSPVRTTPKGKVILDFRLASIRHTNRRSYIPCVAWGNNTRFVEVLGEQEPIELIGRLQSREYTKIEKNILIKRTVYEVSVTKFVF